MDALFSSTAEFISRHHAWAGPILGAVTLLESLVLVGAFVPATALMVMAGGLMAAGALDPVSVIIWCVVGAVLGDGLSYMLGRKLGPGALRARILRPHRRKVARTRLLTRRYGVASIFIGRFFGPVRAFVPLIAGMLKMKSRTFQLANAASAIVWVPAVIAPGYLAAKGLAELEALGEADVLTLALVGGALSLVGAFAVWGVVKARMARAFSAEADARAARESL
ncbi:MAG: DedA family protein [Phenylobacterium sp.]|uniref:DedA family protein n=1 Tax=Phenylobacterium sp. TaxID=1871053 RepID=UPI00391D06FD